jgi:hypothetical protein
MPQAGTGEFCAKYAASPNMPSARVGGCIYCNVQLYPAIISPVQRFLSTKDLEQCFALRSIGSQFFVYYSDFLEGRYLYNYLYARIANQPTIPTVPLACSSPNSFHFYSDRSPSQTCQAELSRCCGPRKAASVYKISKTNPKHSGRTTESSFLST